MSGSRPSLTQNPRSNIGQTSQHQSASHNDQERVSRLSEEETGSTGRAHERVWPRVGRRHSDGIIAIVSLGNESIALARDCLKEPPLLGIIAESEANFANRCIDAVLSINKYVFAPEAVDDLLPSDKVPVFARQQDEQLHRDLFQLDGPTGAEQFVAVAVEGEFVELDWT